VVASWWVRAPPECARCPHQCKSYDRFFHGEELFQLSVLIKHQIDTFSYLACFALPFLCHAGWVIAVENPVDLYTAFFLFPS
jgi:hypothetical protein